MSVRRLGMLLAGALLTGAMAANAAGASASPWATVVSLNGSWLLATDAKNVGRQEAWFQSPRSEAQPANVPWILQGTFPGYHGVAWYWRDFTAPANRHPRGRYLLRFGAVDYLAEVWLNGVRVGGHEGGETPFVLDVTEQIRPKASNQLAVRVLNPTHEPIDGIVLNETAHRCKVMPFVAGAAFNHGGITGSVTLEAVPEVRVEELWVVPQPDTGKLQVRVTVQNAGRQPQQGTLEVAVAPASDGQTLAGTELSRPFPVGQSVVEAELAIAQPHLWNVNDPYLYRVTARLQSKGSDARDERSTRCGFRDFRLADGYFRMNGRRIYLRSTHTCNHFPLGMQFPHDPDLVRRDLLNLKAMGFNAVRFIWGAATPEQLDYCDEIGLLVYEESYASNLMADSPKMGERFDANVTELIRRDRNHPSIVMWGLLNESTGGPHFRHGAAMLPMVRELDPTRMVMLNSGRYDLPSNQGGGGIASVAGLKIWPVMAPSEPWVALNATSETIKALEITWPAGQLALHPGPQNQYSVVRWTAPAAGEVEVSAAFVGIAQHATTDVHLLHQGHAIFDARLNLDGAGNEAHCTHKLTVAAGDTLDCVVGSGNGDYGGDSTALTLTIRTADGKRYDAARDFSTASNPNGVWSYGQLPAGPAPDASAFAAYSDLGRGTTALGSIANPGATDWQDVLDDRHLYPRVPHTAPAIQTLRTVGTDGQPVFLSEYGIGSAVDLWRAMRHFEQRQAESLEDAQFVRDKLDRFLADWRQWHLEETFDRPEDFFQESLKKMAPQRTLGLNAIRSNPHIIGHSLTGALDHVMCGEGLTTLFRELKPGTVDALFDAWAPLRWCLFAEPTHVARGAKVHLEAVLANEDVLPPGEYPVRLELIGPQRKRILDRTVTVTIPPSGDKDEPPLAQLCFAEDVVVDGPSGKYQLLATFEHGAAAAGRPAEFWVTDPADMPPVETEIVLWGEDPTLATWLAEHGIRTRPFAATPPTAREVILVSDRPAAPGGAAAFRELVRRIARGASVVFLTPDVFDIGETRLGYLPLVQKGKLAKIYGWLYLKDEWCKEHPIFAGMPCGGLMDYGYYRELIPDLVFADQEPPREAVAGAIKASQDYASGLMLAVYPIGQGRFVLNTLAIRENLGHHPAAERLLRNLLRDAARDVAQPLAELPADFETHWKALGLEDAPPQP